MIYLTHLQSRIVLSKKSESGNSDLPPRLRGGLGWGGRRRVLTPLSPSPQAERGNLSSCHPSSWVHQVVVALERGMIYLTHLQSRIVLSKKSESGNSDLPPRLRRGGTYHVAILYPGCIK